MNSMLRGASSAALLVGLSGFATAFAPALGQETQTAPVTQDTQAAPQPPATVVPTPVAAAPPASVERVVITGSLVAGASEDAPLPVEVFDLEQLTQQGAPTAAEFLRSLTISTEGLGEADSNIIGANAGLATVNLRGLGADRTMVLLNGRRFASTDTADINTLPMMAIGRIDVLKDGASVTYGAGAVGGVINYITRRNFDGFEINVEKKIFSDSDGEDNIEALWGIVGDSSNMLFAASYGKRHELSSQDRDFSTLPYSQIPATYTTFSTNPSDYYVFGTTTQNPLDFTRTSCQEIGGQITRDLNGGATTSNACAIYLPQFFNLVDEEIYTRGHFEYNSDLSDTLEFHAEVSYAKTDNPNIKTGPALPAGGVRAVDTARASGIAAFQIPYDVPIYNAAGTAVGTARNPYAEWFFNNAQVASATGVFSPYAGPRSTIWTGGAWRPLMFGGHPLYPGNHRTEKQQRERFGGSMSVKGDFSDDGLLGLGRFLPEGTTFEYAATYNRYENEVSRPDWVVSRLQNALRGYGGQGCQAVDRVATNYASSAAFDASVGIQSDTAPGTNGCLYFNPFSSSFQTSAVNGGANSRYGGASFENSTGLLDWLVHDRRFETTNSALTIDAVYTGEIPGFELPGREIGWAAGLQWRQTESRGMALGSEEDILTAQSLCPWGSNNLGESTIGQYACVGTVGPFFSSGLGRQPSFKTDRQTLSYFAEMQIPVLDNLNFQAAVRREDFGDFAGTIYKIAGKYDILSDLSLRGSYSTNFKAPPDDLGAQGIRSGGVYFGSLFRTLPTTIETVNNITPEDDTGQNYGVIYAPEVFGGQLRMSADWFQFEIIGEIGTTSLTRIFQEVFNTPSPSATSVVRTGLTDQQRGFCSLITFVGQAPGSCVSGTASTAIQSIRQFEMNTGGFVNNGIDYSMDYTRDIGPGEGFIGFTATQNLVYKVKGYDLPQVTTPGGSTLSYQFSYDGLGFANLTRNGTIMPEWKINGRLGYTIENHSFNLRLNYTQGIDDEKYIVNDPRRDDYGRALAQSLAEWPDAPVGRDSAGNLVFATYGIFAEDYVDADFSYIYTPSWTEDASLRLSILNITDENPMPAQNTNAAGTAQQSRTGYYFTAGNPRGRQVELSVTKKF